jgi:hypothetical protein
VAKKGALIPTQSVKRLKQKREIVRIVDPAG